MTQNDANAEAIRDEVARRYGQIAQSGGEGCCCSNSGCCGSQSGHAEMIGYDAQQLENVPDGADLGLGCGNPTALTMIEPGMTVVDLGSGAGIDCFLAAKQVGPSGKVIGVDMTDQMLARARQFAIDKGYDNVEFRKGLIEAMPVDDASVDLVISNCVINLSPDKPKVFNEVARVLKPGGKAAVSDIVLLRPLPEAIRTSVEAYISCLAGAMMVDDYLADVRAAGLTIESANRKAYDIKAVLTSAPELAELTATLPTDFEPGEYVAALDLVAVR